MSALGYSIAAISDIPQADSVDNVLANRPGVKLARPSKVIIYMTRETIEVLAVVTVGGTNVFSSGPTNISTVIGSLPSTQDDKIIEVVAARGDEIIVSGTNSAAAAARELRVLVQVMPIAK